jgi:predicted Zn-ribbon and HTH transcriptional regulator
VFAAHHIRRQRGSTLSAKSIACRVAGFRDDMASRCPPCDRLGAQALIR